MSRAFPTAVIENLQPLVDGGRYLVKRVAGALVLTLAVAPVSAAPQAHPADAAAIVREVARMFPSVGLVEHEPDIMALATASLPAPFLGVRSVRSEGSGAA